MATSQFSAGIACLVNLACSSGEGFEMHLVLETSLDLRQADGPAEFPHFLSACFRMAHCVILGEGVAGADPGPPGRVGEIEDFDPILRVATKGMWRSILICHTRKCRSQRISYVSDQTGQSRSRGIAFTVP